MILQTPAGKIAYSTFGERKNKSIIFIHGFPFDKSMWDEQATLISKDHFVITYDVRGHGGSDVGSGQYLVEFFVDDLISLLEHTDTQKAVVCGLSMGGYVALRAIDRAKDRFSGLILCDTKATADTNAAKLNRAVQIATILAGKKSQFADGQLKALFAPESFEKRIDAVKKIDSIINSTQNAGLVGVLIALAARMDMTDSLEKISVPTLIIVGEKDRVTTSADAEFMHDRIRNSKLITILGAGHISNMENPQEFNSALTGFLAGNGL